MAITAVALSPENRTDALRRLGEEQFDILVIGAGVVGAGAALDAASRGLKVGLVEARDFASGTSSRSSKLVHGGLRYLKQLNFHLVFEALRERSLILENAVPAPRAAGRVHLPAGDARSSTVPGSGTGVGVYDVLGAGTRGPRPPQHLIEEGDAASASRSGKPGAIKGGIKFYEGQLDDARHTMVLARTAAEYGAAVAIEHPGDLVPARRRQGGRRGRPRSGVGQRDPDPGERPRSTPPGSGPTRSRR